MTGRWMHVVVRIANAGDVHAPARAHAVVGRSLTVEGPVGLPDIVLLSEVSSVNVLRMTHLLDVDVDEVDVIQWGGGQGRPESGVAIVSLLGPITRRRRVVGFRETAEGGGIRERSWTGAVIVGKWWWSGHAHPPRATLAQAAYIARGRLLRGLLGADWNRAPAWMRRAVLRAYRGSEVLGAAAPRGWRPRLLGEVEVGSDHPAVDIEVRIWLKRENLLFRGRRRHP